MGTMFPARYFSLCIAIFVVASGVNGREIGIQIASNTLDLEKEIYHLIEQEEAELSELKETVVDNVKVQFYYETFDPYARLFESMNIPGILQVLGDYLDFHPYPFGLASMDVEPNGEISFACVYGPEECYGNKLHACAIDIVKNMTKAMLYNSCMMDVSQKGDGSNDLTADSCGSAMNINPEPIKKCAKGEKGSQLLKFYAEETSKVNLQGNFPLVIINGVYYNHDDLLMQICDAYKNPPPYCAHTYPN